VPIGTFKVELRQASGETHRLRFLVENVVANTTSEIGSPRGSRPTYFSFQTKVIINSGKSLTVTTRYPMLISQ